MTSVMKEGGIKSLLQEAVLQAKQLNIALQAEHSALNRNSLGAFEKAIEAKLLHAKNIELVEQQLFSLLKNSGYNWDKEGINQYIKTLNSPAEQRSTLKLWSNLVETVKACQQQNQINGRILNIASVNIRQALDILTGRDPNSKTYSASGKTNKDSKNNSIAVA